jgi:hypothetical protein
MWLVTVCPTIPEAGGEKGFGTYPQPALRGNGKKEDNRNSKKKR